MKLIFIGRGAAFTKNEINNSAYMIKDNTFILLDIGADVFKAIINKGLLENKKLNKIILLITHLHDDHIGSLTSLLNYITYAEEVKHIKKVYIHNTINNLLADDNNRDMDAIDYLELHGFFNMRTADKVSLINSDYIRQYTGLDILYFEVPHAGLLAYSYIVIDRNEKEAIYFSVDCKAHDVLLEQLNSFYFNGYSITAYIECTTYQGGRNVVHFSQEFFKDFKNKAFEIADDNNIRLNIKVTHIDKYEKYDKLVQPYIVEIGEE